VGSLAKNSEIDFRNFRLQIDSLFEVGLEGEFQYPALPGTQIWLDEVSNCPKWSGGINSPPKTASNFKSICRRKLPKSISEFFDHEPTKSSRNSNFAPLYLKLLPVPTVSEVKEAIDLLKKNKAPGNDSLPAELFKSGGEVLMRALVDLQSLEWRTLTWRVECGNYRVISLLPAAYKLFSLIIASRLKPMMETFLHHY
jgi:hypothetical protein